MSGFCFINTVDSTPWFEYKLDERNTRSDKKCKLCTKISSEKLKLFQIKLKLRSRRFFTQEKSIFVPLHSEKCVTLARILENCHLYKFLCNLWFSNVLSSGCYSCLAVHSLKLMLWTVRIIRSAATLTNNCVSPIVSHERQYHNVVYL